MGTVNSTQFEAEEWPAEALVRGPEYDSLSGAFKAEIARMTASNRQRGRRLISPQCWPDVELQTARRV
jgi:hypothetical protein